MYNSYNNPYYNPNYSMQPMNTYPQTNRLDNQTYHQTTNNYQIPMLQGKQVESVDIVKSIEIPLDGTISYFPLADGSTIVTKQLQNDGTTKIKVFKPSEDNKEENKYITRDEFKKIMSEYQNDDNEYVTKDELKDLIKKINLDDIEEEIKDIKKQLKKKGE